jgi:hypothetical protein
MSSAFTAIDVNSNNAGRAATRLSAADRQGWITRPPSGGSKGFALGPQVAMVRRCAGARTFR